MILDWPVYWNNITRVLPLLLSSPYLGTRERDKKENLKKKNVFFFFRHKKDIWNRYKDSSRVEGLITGSVRITNITETTYTHVNMMEEDYLPVGTCVRES